MIRTVLCAVVMAALAWSSFARPLARGPNGEVPPGATAVLLGQGSPLLNASRSGTSVGIAVRGTLYVFDAGPGVERRIFEVLAQHAALAIKTIGISIRS